MFSNSKAPAWMLAIPVILLLVTITLAVLLIMNLNNSAQTNSDNQQQNAEDTTTSQQQNSNQASNNQESQNPHDKFVKALSAIPENGFPANQCPEAITTEESNGNIFALDKDRKYSISADMKAWIESNCPDVEKLIF